jgi:hypothetical protein
VSDGNMLLFHRFAIRGFLIGTLELKALVGLLVLIIPFLVHISGLGINH